MTQKICELCKTPIPITVALGYMSVEILNVIPLKYIVHYRCQECGSWKNPKEKKQ